MYKCHDFITNDIAYLLRATVPGIEVFGGIALNRTTRHGQRAGRQDGYAGHRPYCRCIWMPTYQSAFDMRKKGGGGVPVLDAQGKVRLRSSRSWKSAPTPTSFSPRALLSRRMRRAHRQARKWASRRRSSRTRARPRGSCRWIRPACIDNGAYLEHSVLPYFKGPHAVIPGYREQPQVTMEEFASYIASPRIGSSSARTSGRRSTQPRRRDAHVHHRAAQGRGEGRRAERRYPEDPGHAAGAGPAFRGAQGITKSVRARHQADQENVPLTQGSYAYVFEAYGSRGGCASVRHRRAGS